MTWKQLEKMFNRAVCMTFVRAKGLLTFVALALCGLCSVICRGISLGASPWVRVSLMFLPIFLCSGLLLALGLVLVRLYRSEVAGEQKSLMEGLRDARPLMKGVPYVAVPLIFAYLILWIVLGVFYLIKEIPYIGSSLESILSFGPLLLAFGSIALGCLSLLVLFFVVPAAALQNALEPRLAQKMLVEVSSNPFRSVVMLFIGVVPVLLIGIALSLAVLVIHLLYIEGSSSFAILMRWFVMMLPFCALLTPAVIFFFNFSCEAHVAFVQGASKAP